MLTVSFRGNFIINTTQIQSAVLVNKVDDAKLMMMRKTNFTNSAPFHAITGGTLSDLGNKVLFATEHDSRKLQTNLIAAEMGDVEMSKRGFNIDNLRDFYDSKELSPNIKSACEDYNLWTKSSRIEHYRNFFKKAIPLSFEEAMKMVENYIKNVAI